MSVIPTLGAYEIGSQISTMLFGVTSLQVWHYFRQFKHDHPMIKTLVIGTWAAECAHTITVVHTLYHYSIIHFGRAQQLAMIPMSLAISVGFNLVIPAIQGFFTYRIYVLSGRKILFPLICFTLVLVRVATVLIVMSFAILEGNFHDFQIRARWAIILTLSNGAFLDVVIAVALAYLLGKGRSGRRETNGIVDRLIMYAIETGAITSAFSLIMAICFATMRNWVWLAIYVFLAKLYSNSLLASLNARPQLQQSLVGASASGARPTVGSRTGQDTTASYSFAKKGEMSGVEMSTIVESTTDNDVYGHPYAMSKT